MRFRTLIFTTSLVLSTASAQLHSVDVFGSYSAALTKRLAVTKATAFGGGAEIRFSVFEIGRINLMLGYERYTIDQDSALAQWNWRFYNERYAGIVKENLAIIPGLSALLNPIQYMEVVPLIVTVGVEVSPLDRFVIRPSLGGGILFYVRSLYLDEQWTKRFDAQNYTFGYSFRNFAQDKRGNPLLVAGELALAYQISDGLCIESLVRYSSVLKTEGRYGYGQFPFRSAMSVSIGMGFLY